MSTPITRRAFVARAGGALFFAMVDNRPLRRLADARAAAAAGPVRTIRVVRADDQLDVLVELYDVAVVGDVLNPSGANPRVHLTFGSQHTAEGTYTGTDAVSDEAVGEYRAGPSVVVAPLAAATAFTLAGILDLAAATLATSAGTPVTGGTTTAIEVPAGLVLAPVAGTRLEAAVAPVRRSDTAEVWTARFVPGAVDGTVELTALDDLGATVLPANSLPDAGARADIASNSVALAPLGARQLWLSSSGAFAVLDGAWDGATVGVTRYHHEIVAGRDDRVEVVSTGYLLPFGQRAAITAVAERVVATDVGGADTAIGRVGLHLTLIDPVAGAPIDTAEQDGRALPFTSTIASVSSSVEIELVDIVDGTGTVPGGWGVHTAGTPNDLVVEYLAVDRAGGTVSFALPAIFVDDSVAFDTASAGSPARLRGYAATVPALTHLDLGGQRLAYATAAGPGSDTTKATHAFDLAWTAPVAGATADQLRAAGTPAVHLAMVTASVVDDVVAALGGELGSEIDVTLHPRWLEFGNDLAGNFDLSFLGLARPVSALLGEDIVGAVADLEIVGEVFNQLLGLGPDLGSLAEWTPARAFGQASKIIAGISLADLLEGVVDEVLAETLPGVEVDVRGGEIVTTYTMCQKLGSLPAVGFVAGDATELCIVLTATVSLDDATESSFTTTATIEEFQLHFPPGAPTLVVVDFASLTATIGSDGTRDLVPVIRSWDFSGAISVLRSLVDGLGMGNVDLKVLGDRIDLDASIALPDVELGVVSVKNFTIVTGLELPLGEGAGVVSIGLGSPSSPVDVDVMMFGGSFWVNLELSFGGGVPPASVIGFGVSVYWEMLDFDIVVVEISFALRLSADFRLADGEIVFTGAVSLEGNIEVLGLVDVTASIVGSLTYDSAAEQLTLKGTVHYGVDSFLGSLASGSVPIGSTSIALGRGPSALRAGRSARLTAAPFDGASFADRYSPSVWTDYCHAFA